MVDAQLFAETLLGGRAELTPLPGERDLNFAVQGEGGARYVLKLHHPDTDPAVLDLQDVALAHLAAHRVEAPRLIAREVQDGRVARLLSWLEGRPWAEIDPSPAQMRQLGRHVAAVDRALRDFSHPAQDRDLLWNLTSAGRVAALAGSLDADTRALVEPVFTRHAEFVAPRLDALPAQVLHNDANEFNVLVGEDGTVTGLLDYGDLARAPRACGLAIAVAYAMQQQLEPVRAVAPLVAGYDEVAPLAPAELELVFDLARTRLAMSVVMAAHAHAQAPDNDYLLVSQAGVRGVLEALAGENPDLAHFRFRDACGWDAVPSSRAVRAHLARTRSHSVLTADVATAPAVRVAYGQGLSADEIFARIEAAGAAFAYGGYREHRAVYTAPEFRSPDGERWRNVHMGVDLWAPAGEPILAPLDGVVHAAEHRPAHLDYGGLLLLVHRTDDGVPFMTLYGHMDAATLPPVGTAVRAGEEVGRLGDETVNGGWPPHLHFQLITHDLRRGTDYDGVAYPEDVELWGSLCPDPNLVLGRREGDADRPPLASVQIAARRRASLSRTLSLAYREPLHIVRGEGAYLIDDAGTRWLDLVNNVAHVGHSHPRVVEAAARQNALLNTNTRYLHRSVVEYAHRLAAELPDPLRVVFLVNSGSEANDLALRLARTHTGRRDVVVMEHAYHGHLSSLVEMSPYKFDRAGGAGKPDHVHVMALGVAPAFPAVEPAAFFVESIMGCAGQVPHPPGFLRDAFAAARAAGAVCVADEVQVGFGRVGEHLWAFELGGVVPDIVTMGKPIGNGHPLAAVVTTPEIADSFATGMEYFNTFGGNPVSAEVGHAVLDVIRDERLQEHARERGAQLLAGLAELARRHDAIADARGHGLFLGVQLDSTARAQTVKEGLKAHGILVSTDGPLDDVLKIKPPLVISAADCDRVLEALDAILG